LYELDDATIIRHLKGELSPELDFWKASELERQPYKETMFDVPNIVTEDTIGNFIDALGYYHAASIVAQRIFTSQVSDATKKSLIFNKPYIWQSVDVYPVVYINGVKVTASDINYQNNNNGTVSIRWNDALYTPVGTEITIYYFPLGRPTVYKFVPTEDEYVITIPSASFKIYEKSSSVTILGLYTTSDVGYKVRTVGGDIFSTTNNDGTVSLLFHSSLYDKEFYVVYDDTTRYYYKELTDDISEKKSFVVDLTVNVSGTEENIPMLNVKDTAVYFNNRYLVKDVDYKLVLVPGYDDDDIGIVQVVISNMSYGKDNEINKVEVIATSIEIEDSDHGFVINNTVSDDLDVDIWFPNLSIVHINGKYSRHIINTGIKLTLPEGMYTNGSIFELKNSIPKEITTLLLPSTPNNDRERIVKIEQYFHDTFDTPSDDVVLPGSHHIYSPYLNYLIQGIINEDLILTYDPVEENMRNQLLPYTYLQKYDPIFDDPSSLNMRFIDIYPAYTNTVADPKWRELITGLANIILPTDTITSGVPIND